jgi:endoglucanase
MGRHIFSALAGALMIFAAGCGDAIAWDNSVPLTSENVIAQMSPGWNVGNSLEATVGKGPYSISQETAWGNAKVTQELMRSVKAAGFKSVRIPVSWNQYSDRDATIRPFWLGRVKEVVDYANKAGLYVVINVHWDGGWLQPTYKDQDQANARLVVFWKQIATHFKDYDDRLLFAGTNEVMVTNVYSAPTAENCKVQNGFNQMFVAAVRATGGNNTNRWLVVQSYNTDINHALSCNAKMPVDTVDHRLMMEVHYYDPFNFTLNEKSKIWQWGKIATEASATETWANEAYTDAQFKKMKDNFVDKGVPVILGEYAASRKTEYDPDGKYRNYWDAYITRSAHEHGLVPMYWDNGVTSNHSSGLFDRATGAQVFPETIAEIVKAAQ